MLRGLVLLALWAAGVGGLSTPARAIELTTTWVSSGGNQQIRCRAVNTGKKPATVVAEILSSTGVNLATLTFTGCDGSAPIPQHGVCSAVVIGSATGYCRFTTSSKAVRGALTLELQAASEVVYIYPATR